ncbi:DUF6993 domain-containing protein [Arthrobacter sp. CDRTa11]|uniref:DUF6993 domain-containing protein n=1 Tax=Arthrobacter sp. CDRTa11 TaxID=2651199 RepID=UPI002265C0C8|nr:hypothetical protein [Arthrobacter sp. CDRTa11]
MKRATEHRKKNHVGVLLAVRQEPTASFGRVWAGCVVVAASLSVAVSLSACTGGAQSNGDKPGAPAATTTQAPSPATPSSSPPEAASPGGAAAGSSSAAGGRAPAEDPATAVLRQTVTDVLSRLAAGTPKPATAQVTEALTGAGIAAAALEVSQSSTPTGLEADAVEAAVLQGSDCVVGQIRDGGVAVTVLPVLATGKCFVGSAA